MTDGFDVAIVGGSIAGQALAARLARAGGLRVALIDAAPAPSRRLVGGCSLRRGTLERLAAIFGVAPEALMARLGAPQSCFSELGVSFPRDHGDRWEVQHRLVRAACDGAPIGLSVRHALVLEALRSLLPPEVHRREGRVPAGGYTGEALHVETEAGTEALPLAPGHRVVNASANPRLLRAEIALPPPRRWVAAVQVPLRPDDAAPGPSLGYAPAAYGDHGRHLAFFTPFWDPASPEATWYGINTTVLETERLEAVGREAILADLEERLGAWAEGAGFSRVDPEQTTGRAVVPISERSGVQWQQLLGDGSPVVEGSLTLSAGAQAINVDGMLAQAVGADALADSLLRHPTATGPGLFPTVDRALHGIRRRNRILQGLYFTVPHGALAATFRVTPMGVLRSLVGDWAGLGAPPE